MLKNYPDLTENTATTVSVFSMIKSILTSLFFIALIIMLVTLGIKSFKPDSNK